MKRKYTLVALKTAFALLGLSAIITEIAALVGRNIFDAGNFFSFFTVESNLLAALVLIVSAFATLHDRRSRMLDLIRGAAAVYMATTGIVFSVLLAGIENATLTAVPWDNIVLHYIMPVVLVADWFIDRPHAHIELKMAAIWLAYPLAYVIYSLIRGHITGWYPYPFLDPAPHGYTGVVVTGLFIALTITVIAYIFTRPFGRTSRA